MIEELKSEKAFKAVLVICFILTIISMEVAPDTEYNAAPTLFAVHWYLVSTGGEGFDDTKKL